MARLGWSGWTVLLVMVAVPPVVWFFAFEPLRSHARWYNRVRDAIRELASRRPPEVSRGQWEFVIGWTLNLHANCGGSAGAEGREWQEAFVAELKRRLQGPVGLNTIDWIWDEYERATRHGKDYSDRWRPTRPENLAQAEYVSFGIQVK